MRRGKFIVVDGIDGCGKTTLIAGLQKQLEKRLPKGTNVLSIREPGGTDYAEALRAVFLEKGQPCTESERILTLATCREGLVRRVIGPALDNGDWVICSRYYYATLAYQGQKVENANLILTLKDELAWTIPDLALIANIDTDVALTRMRKDASREKLDWIEQSGDAFWEKVTRSYRLQAISNPECVKLNCEQPAKDVLAEALATIERRLF